MFSFTGCEVPARRPHGAQICSPLSGAPGEIFFHPAQVCLTSMATSRSNPSAPRGWSQIKLRNTTHYESAGKMPERVSEEGCSNQSKTVWHHQIKAIPPPFGERFDSRCCLESRVLPRADSRTDGYSNFCKQHNLSFLLWCKKVFFFSRILSLPVCQPVTDLLNLYENIWEYLRIWASNPSKEKFVICEINFLGVTWEV